MPNFLTRVELHGARATDYEELHRQMAARNFFRTIAGGDGRLYALPTAEYRSHGEVTAADVRELARAAAAATGLQFWILVAEYTNATWYLHQIDR